MQTQETPYEYFNNKLGVKVKFLVCDETKRHNDSLNLIKYRSLSYRTKSKTCTEKQLRRASLGFDALVEYNTLDIEWRNLLNITFGKPKEEVKKSYFAKHYEADRKAFDYFRHYRYGQFDEKKLPPEVIELYTYNASVLNTALIVKANRKAYAKALGVKNLDIWKSLSADVNDFDKVAHDLPTTRDSLRYKVNRYKKEGYASVISGKYGNRNGTKVSTREQQALLTEILKKHQNLNYEQAAYWYNLTAKATGWKIITAETVNNFCKKNNINIYSGRRGDRNFKHNKAMQVKRSAPSLPMVYWTMDGWDVELFYQKETINKKGQKVVTYTNRLTAVIVLDPYNKYPMGYAIGDAENPKLIKDALHSAIHHTKELFGERYKPYQLQTDRYQIKHLTPLYKATTKHFTPAEAGNAKSKVIENYFDKFNKKYFQKGMAINWSGYNVSSKKSNQPNDEYLNKIRHKFPDEQACRMQIINAIEQERKEKLQAYLEGWRKLPEVDKIIFETEEYLRWYGATTGFTNKLMGQGITPTIEGQTYYYDSFDLQFRNYGNIDWCIRYDVYDLSQVLVTNAESRQGKLVKEIDTISFLLDQKHEQPMALYDRKEGDSDQLQKVFNYDKELRNQVIKHGNENIRILQDLYQRNPELEVLQKMLIVDSNGQHKALKNKARLQPPTELEDDYDFEIIDDIRSNY